MSNVAIIVGSHRENSESLKVGKMIAGKLEQHASCDSAQIVELATAGLPDWSESYSNAEQTAIDGVKATLASADALVVISPEWNGMVPAKLKNFFLLFSAAELGHKPGLIASVSAGIGGTYPIAELRTSSYKNCRICYLPEHIIYRQIGEHFNEEGAEADDYILRRTDYALEILLQYSLALAGVRKNLPDGRDFANGM